MSERKYEVGDEVWVRGRVTHLDIVRTAVSIGDRTDVAPEDIRTAEDFKDPLDAAIVKAAIGWFIGRGNYEGVKPGIYVTGDTQLEQALRAKLDANKPKLQVGDKVR